MEKFKEILAAYRVLSDSQKKALYDDGEDFSQQACEEEGWIENAKLLFMFFKKEDQREARVQKEKHTIFTSIHNKYDEEYKELIKKFQEQKNVVDKTEEINELRKGLEHHDTCQKLLKEIESGNFEGCRLIIEGDTIATDDIAFLVQFAIAHDRVEIFNLLSKKRTGVPPNDDLSSATKYGSENISYFLLDKYVNEMDVEYTDEKGNTALHHALEWLTWGKSNYQSFVKSLLSKGARLGDKNNKGETPFDLLLRYTETLSSARKKEVEGWNYISELLSDHKIDELKESEGTLPLNKLVNPAIKHCCKGVFNFLIINNVQISSTTLKNIVIHDYKKELFGCFLHKNKVDYQDKSGDTALHHALRNLRYDDSTLSKAESLASAGANFDIKNKKGETPFDLLIKYVEGGFYGKASRLSYARKLLNKCENKDGTLALNKLKELHVKYRNTSIIAASTLAVIGVALGVAIAVHLEMLAVGIGIGGVFF